MRELCEVRIEIIKEFVMPLIMHCLNLSGKNDKAGFLFQVDRPINPDTGEVTEFGPGILGQEDPVSWITK